MLPHVTSFLVAAGSKVVKRGICRGFFAALKEWKLESFKFTGKPKPPNYKPRAARYKVEYPNTRAYIGVKKDGIIHLSSTNIKIKTSHALDYDSVRIIPATGCYVIEVVYSVSEVKPLENGFIAAIDLGVNNLATVTTNKLGFQPILINGRPVKSINNRFNKTISSLRSTNKKLHGIDWTYEMELLTRRRNHRIDSYLHRASSKIIETLVSHFVGTLVIGLNPDWKRNCNIGRVNNQKFVAIPHKKLVDMLRYKGARQGIKVITREESYTSKASFLDQDTIPTYGNKPENWNPSGRRIKRGLYKSNSGLINADVNGSYNILVKEFPHAFSQGITGCVVQPRLVNLPGFITKPPKCSSLVAQFSTDLN